MAFLNPLFLFGLLAAGIPLVIHLWNRRRVVTIDFSSLIFLTAAHRENARRFQLRQLLILLLRMAIIALIALALARPFLTLGLPVASVRAKTDVVIVLDNSYSMAYQDINGIRFEKAKTLATDIIDTLRHGDSAALILMSDIPKPIFRQLTPDLESVITAINDTETSYRTTNVQSSLELAHEILTERKGEVTAPLHKEIYLISDFARNGWKNWGRLPNRSGARISLIPVAEGDAHNISIKEIRPSNQLIGVDLPFQLNVTTVNHSVAPLDQNILTLFIGGEKQKTMSFSAAANQSLNTALTYNFSTPGTHIGHFTLTDDRLNIDNQRYFALDALGEVRVLCVGEQTEYLTLALNPHRHSGHPSAVSRQQESLVETGEKDSNRYSDQLIADSRLPTANVMILPTQCTPVDFETFPLEDYDVIILADVLTMSRQINAQLQEFIRQGKSIIVFVSSRTEATSYNGFSNVWLPAQLGSTLTWTPPQRVQAYQEIHPIFDIFPSEGFSMQYAPQFYNGMALQPVSESNVIARFGDDTPFLVERSQGTGTVLLYNCGLMAVSRQQSGVSGRFVGAGLVPAPNGQPQGIAPTPENRLTDNRQPMLSDSHYTNDLLVNPYFLPMLQQSVLYATVSSKNFLTWGGHIGDTYTAHYPRSAGGKAAIHLMPVNSQQPAEGSAQPPQVPRTENREPKAKSHSTVVPIAEDGTLRFQGTERPGIYQIEVQTQDRTQRDFFAVNVDTTEADLTEISLAQAAARIGAQTAADPEIEGNAAAVDTYNVKRHGREIWGELLVLVVCLMLLESFLSNREGALTVGEV